MKRVAVLVSGGGTNLQALIDASKRGEMPSAQLSLVVASKSDAYALTRAQEAGIECAVLRRKDFSAAAEFGAAMVALLQAHNIDVVVLAGYLTILGAEVIRAFPERIINIHPSLIPAFCGDGFYGLHVHEAVLARGCKLTGATVHLVNEIVDGGRILLQKAVAVEPGDTAQQLQLRVMQEAEWSILPQAVEGICGGVL